MKCISTMVVLLFFFGCATQKPDLYVYPKGIVPEKKAEFIQYCEKGRVLYGIHCAKCHSTTVAGKEVIPDFTPLQLDAYDMRLGLTKHQSALTERNIPEEELEQVIFFLTHKKPNEPAKTKK